MKLPYSDRYSPQTEGTLSPDADRYGPVCLIPFRPHEARSTRRRRPRLPARVNASLLTSALLLPLLAAPAAAQICTVPGSHATIQEAIFDPTCVTITLKAAHTYTESIHISRSLTIDCTGAAGAVIQGLVRVQGAGAQVTLQDLAVENGCIPSALAAISGAEVTGTNLAVVHSAALPCPPVTTDTIFADGFESGDTTSWSSTAP